MPINHKEIENKALDVLDRYSITEPVVNVEQIAEGEGIKIKEIVMSADHNDVAGFYDDDEKTIYVNVVDKPGRKLFTVAHELGHIFLGHANYSVLYRVPREGVTYTGKEKEANSFAASLLMPEFMIRNYLEKYNFNVSDYVEMSKIFGVPIMAMKSTLERALRQ